MVSGTAENFAVALVMLQKSNIIHGGINYQTDNYPAAETFGFQKYFSDAINLQ